MNTKSLRQEQNVRAIKEGLILGAVLAVVLFLGVVVAGQTFGQRCAKIHEKGTEPYRECVSELANGKKDSD